MADPFADALDGDGDPACERHMVILDQHGIIQAETVIGTATGAYGGFFQEA